MNEKVDFNWKKLLQKKVDGFCLIFKNVQSLLSVCTEMLMLPSTSISG